MKKSNWLLLVLFAAAAAGLRVRQELTGFDAAGLAIRGNLSGILLPVVLAFAAGWFAYSARALPARGADAAGLAEVFCFENTAPTACAVAGAFLVLAGAAASILYGGRSTQTLLLAVFAMASAVSVLYAVFALRRGNEAQGVALLVPVCCLIVYLIFLYRAGASDPVLARIYVEILAVALLTLGALELAAFAFRVGAPRVYVPVNALAAILAVAAASERRSPASVLLFTGCALIELGFFAAAEFGQRK